MAAFRMNYCAMMKKYTTEFLIASKEQVELTANLFHGLLVNKTYEISDNNTGQLIPALFISNILRAFRMWLKLSREIDAYPCFI